MNLPRRHSKRLYASLRNRRGLARNLLVMVFVQGVNYLAPLLTFPHLARTLHPAGFGQYGIYLLIGGWMTIASDWGTNLTGARLIAQRNALAGDIDEAFWNIFFLRLAIVILILAGVAAYLGATRANFEQVLLLVSAWTMILGNALTVSWCLQGLERLDAFATAAVIGRLFTVPATILLVRHADQVWLAVAVQGIGGVIIGAASIIILKRSGAVKRLRWSWRGCVRQWQEGLPILVSTASHGLFSSTSTALLGFLRGAYATGLFIAADRIRLAAQGTVLPINQALYPRLSRLAVTDPRQAVRTIRILLVAQGTVMAIGCLLLAIFAPLVIRVIAGPGYEQSVPVLRILAFAIGIYVTNAVLGGQTLMPFGFSREFGRINFYTALFNVTVMPGLVYYWGPSGAAVGVLGTECFMLLCYSFVIFRKRLLAIDGPRGDGLSGGPAND